MMQNYHEKIKIDKKEKDGSIDANEAVEEREEMLSRHITQLSTFINHTANYVILACMTAVQIKHLREM